MKILPLNFSTLDHDVSRGASTQLLHVLVQNCSLVHIKLDLGVVYAICRTGF